MTSTVKKKGRRLKRSIRKTLGALFLASAIIIAAIPVDNLQAATNRTEKKITLHLNSETNEVNRSNIPDVKNGDEIYTTGDGKFQFAYIYPAGYTSGPKVAVILGYQKGGQLANGLLEIPNTVDAYKKFSNVTTNSGYAAVNKAGNFLYFKDYEYVTDEYGEPVYEYEYDENGDPQIKVDEEGNPIRKREVVYSPCYYEDRAKWENLKDDEFYYNAGTVETPNYVLTLSDEIQRIRDAAVWYIGNQYLTADNSGGWTVAGNVESGSQGIFAGASNISTLIVGVDMTGIGNYAFYGCAGLNSITLNNGLDTIGNYAFANCVNMEEVNIDISANVSIIGDHAFYNCQALKTFTMPRAVTKIGDSAFEECYALKHIELTGNGSNVRLQQIGYDVFKGCTNLEGITFPRTFMNADDNGNAEAIDVTTFKGCGSLQFIATSANLFDVKEGDDPEYGFEEFKADVLPTFYFKGNQGEALHKTSTAHEFAFSYYDTALERDVYELTVTDEDGKKAVYRVDDNDELVYCEMEDGMSTVILPTTIGPNSIRVIDEYTFQNNCDLESITIPASITSITKNAFKGCHHLKNVIFTNPTNLTSIGSGAFRTQDCSAHKDRCNTSLEKAPLLNFVGPISYDCVPFQYAMDPAEKINVGTQDETYITYHSGWPTNLVVRYDSETDMNTLVDYPTFKDIQSGTKYTTENYAYMTDDYEDAARKAVQKYIKTYTPDPTDPEDTTTMTDYEKEIVKAAVNITIPEGIEAIGTVTSGSEEYGLFEYNEKNNELVSDDLGNGVILRKSITAESLIHVGAEAFKGAKYVSAIKLEGDTQTIGDYAFADCDVLTKVDIPASVNTLGLRPFTRCDLLADVNFNGGSYFTCDNSIIYELGDSGAKTKIVEYLCGRSSTSVKADEVAGILEIYPEAFMETGVSMVDLSEAEIENVPISAFQHTLKMYSVSLPETCKSISEDAFSDTTLQQLRIPDSVSVINNYAFRDTDGDGYTNKSTLEFECVEGSAAYIYAKQNGIKTTTYIPEVYYTVSFWDWDMTLLEKQQVLAGTDAIPPEVPGREGYVLTGWVPDYRAITSDLAVTAQYEAIDPETQKFTVTFLDYDDTVLKEVKVLPGESAEPPANPVREGYRFIGWRNSYTNVTQNVTIYAQYEKIDSSEKMVTVRFIDWNDTVLSEQKVVVGGNAIIPQSPKRDGYIFVGWRPMPEGVTKDTDVYAMYEIDVDGDGDNSDNNGDKDDNDGNDKDNMVDTDGDGVPDTPVSKLFTLTVVNGSGSGSYLPGAQPIIICNDPSDTQEFSHWTIDPANTFIASKNVTATVITMPSANVTVTAHYKTKEGATDTNRPSSGGTSTNGGTTVVIDKNGLSNTGVVSVVVNGSSDNFTIKISDSTKATEAVVKALKAEYGNNISDIKYVPMDISLYDSTGTKKITDTSGLSIKITLPLPDSLIAYAGNNKVASVVDDRLDKLSAKFTTINGVPCVTFTAEHFSPYVIYVDTDKAASTPVVPDDTPKTGDGVHPKWFLSIGLACLSFVMFMTKDNKKKQKVSVRA